VKSETFDFVVIGSGFGGSIMSMVLRRLGKSVLLLERGSHPRFAIGESSTPFANLLLERLADEYDLGFLRSLSEWGQWQDTFPQVPAGLKRGFTFYHHTPGQHLDFSDRATQLLVAASPNDRVADTHWYRPAFDNLLVEKAQELGVVYREHATISDVQNDSVKWTMTVSSGSAGDDVRSLVLEPEVMLVSASFLIDATGPGGFEPLQLRRGACPFMPPTSAVYAHFRNVPRLDQFASELRNHALPYPPDDAAVHHVFPGGWIWVLRFNNGITSAGAALCGREREDPLLDRPKKERLLTSSARKVEPQALWHSIVRQFPTLEKSFSSAVPITPFYFTPQLSSRRDRAAGPNWAVLPSAAGFVDPLLSTGFALTLLGIERLGAIFCEGQPELKAYEEETFRELDAAADLVSALYAKMPAPEEFSLLSLLYFAAMSFTETAWRLEKRELASGFLLANDDRFSAERARICAQARGGERIRRDAIAALIEPYDVAGLADWNRNHWYPVDLADLRRNSEKVRASEKDLQRLFEKLGLVRSDQTCLSGKRISRVLRAP
jgi:tetracycline 7-halogenase / FADH2 O2-dependent halogenase